MEKAEAALRRPPVWRPRKLDDTNIEKFRRHVNTRHDLNILTYQELHQWSTDSKTLHDFWVDAYEFLNVGAPGTRSGSALYVEVSAWLQLRKHDIR
jgi:acetoacetyl-CoA synthetase